MTSIQRRILIALTILISSGITSIGQTITTIAGSGAVGFMTGSYGGDGGPAVAALLHTPSGVALDGYGNLYIADTWNHRVRKVDTAGMITTFAGTGSGGYSGDGGPATAAQFGFPVSIAVDAAGNVYVADRSSPSVRKIDAAGIITTVAGNGTFGFGGDGGPATAALLDNPNSVQVDGAGNLYICDWINARVRKVDAAGIITTIAGSGSATFSGDGGQATAAGMRPYAILLAPGGDILVCDAGNARLRKINASGIITTFAGTGTTGYSGDGGAATAAEFRSPNCMVYNAAGELLVSDQGNNVIRKINAAGVITTIAGTGTAGYSGDGGPATAATFRAPAMMVFNTAGELLMPDMQNNRVRKINFSSTPTTTAVSTSARGEVNVYPNPTRNMLYTDAPANTHYNLVSALGSSLLQGTFDKADGVLSLKTLAAGVYYLQLSSPVGGVKTIMVVKE